MGSVVSVFRPGAPAVWLMGRGRRAGATAAYVKEFPPEVPRWAKIAFVALWIGATAAFVIVSIFTGDITEFLIDRVGFMAVVVGGFVGFAIIVWIGWQYDKSDRARRDGRR